MRTAFADLVRSYDIHGCSPSFDQIEAMKSETPFVGAEE
jgi:hypothetical protein